MRWTWIVAVVVACGGDGGGTDATGPGGFARACDESDSDGDCVYYNGEDWSEDDVIGFCAVTPTPSCPTQLSVGTCTVDPGPFETVTTFYSGFWNGSQAAQQCQGAGGTFVES